MTAHLISVPQSLNPHQSWLGNRSRKSSSRRADAQNRSEPSPSVPTDAPATPLQGSDRVTPDALWEVLLNAIQEGVMVVSRTNQLVYCNHQAREICQQLHRSDESSALPAAIAEACHHFLQDDSDTPDPLVVEYQENPSQFIRLQIRWLTVGGTSGTHLMVLIEDCYRSLQQELMIEKQKYDLTDREAEVWMMIRQEFTYQEISERLMISVNTVKTHAKNAYAKRKSLSEQPGIWYSR